MALKIIQLEAKDLVGQYLSFIICNVSVLRSQGDMRTEDISSADLLPVGDSQSVSVCFIPCCYKNRTGLVP